MIEPCPTRTFCSRIGFGKTCASLSRRSWPKASTANCFGTFLPAWGALALASVLFGVLHAMTVVYAVLAVLAGLYLGWLWQATGNLLVPVVCHALSDFLVLLVLLRWQNGAEVLTPPGEEGDGEEERTDEEGW